LSPLYTALISKICTNNFSGADCNRSFVLKCLQHLPSAQTFEQKKTVAGFYFLNAPQMFCNLKKIINIFWIFGKNLGKFLHKKN